MKDNTEHHITMEQLLYYFSLKEVTPEKMELATAIAKHNANCKECSTLYNKVLAIDGRLNAALHITSSEQKQLSMVKALYEFAERRGKRIEGINEIIRGATLSVKLTIQNYLEITGEALANLGNLSHPRLATDLRSTDESMLGAEISSVLMDEKEDMISIQRDGTLILSLSKYRFPQETIVFLIPEEEDKNSYCEMVEPSSKRPEILVAKFKNIEPGEYNILIK